MKKIAILVLAVVICAMFAACADHQVPVKKTGPAASASSSSASGTENTFGLNDAAVFNDLKFTAVELKESQGTQFTKPDAGKTFVGVKFEIENISNESQNISSILLFSVYADDVKCEYSMSAQLSFDEGTLDGEIAPSKKAIGWYAVEVPEKWEKLEFDVSPKLFSNSSARFVFTKQ